MDTFVTEEGRRQLCAGGFRIEYVSFTDSAVYYEADAASGSSDAGERIYFEASSMLHDAIAFEADDAGLLRSKKGLFNDGIGVMGGKLLGNESGLSVLTMTGSSAVFASSGSKLLKSSLENFKKLRVIGSSGQFDEDSIFELSRDNIDFLITDKYPIPRVNSITSRKLDEMGDLFSDRRLSHVPNFKFLPPVNESLISDGNNTSLGSFLPLGPTFDLKQADLISEFNKIDLQGNSIEIEFTDTSSTNNLFGQFFEIGPNDMVKLDVIDYGTFVAEDSNASTHVLFVGKVRENSFKVHTFLHVFTLVFYDKIRDLDVI